MVVYDRNRDVPIVFLRFDQPCGGDLLRVGERDIWPVGRPVLR